MIGYMVIAAADPLRSPVPAEAMHAAPIFAMEAVRSGAWSPWRMRPAMDCATIRPMTPDGIPVRGGAGEITVPFGLFLGSEMACGGAKAIPTPKTFRSEEHTSE